MFTYERYDSVEKIAGALRNVRRLVISICAFLLAMILLMLLWTPVTGPWAQERQGQANLRQATQERKMLVEAARGELMAAQAMADAIKTMGEAAREFPEYRQQMFIGALTAALANGSINRIIYLPVETQMPITEASRFQQ
jgi:hypothetical protein